MKREFETQKMGPLEQSGPQDKRFDVPTSTKRLSKEIADMSDSQEITAIDSRQQITDRLKHINSDYLVAMERWCNKRPDRYNHHAFACRVLIDHIQTATNENPIIAAKQIIDFLAPLSERGDSIKGLLVHIQNKIYPLTFEDLQVHAQREAEQVPSSSGSSSHEKPRPFKRPRTTQGDTTSATQPDVPSFSSNTRDLLPKTMTSDKQALASYNEDKFGKDDEIGQMIQKDISDYISTGGTVDESIKEQLKAYRNRLPAQASVWKARKRDSVTAWKELVRQAQEANNENMMNALETIIYNTRLRNRTDSGTTAQEFFRTDAIAPNE